jgi:hypothetical protein
MITREIEVWKQKRGMTEEDIYTRDRANALEL